MKVFDEVLNMFNKSNNSYISLQRKNDLIYEIEYQKQLISKIGFEVLDTLDNGNGEKIIVYRELYTDGLDDELINICLRVITTRGIKSPDFKLNAELRRKINSLFIADIKVDENNVNKGYGGILLNALIDLKDRYENVISITGSISSVDWDHVERLIHFYKKYGFQIRLDLVKKEGKILCLNKDVKWDEVKIDNYFSEIRFFDFDL